MEWSRLQRYCHLFNHRYFQHVSYRDIHDECASAGQYLWRDASIGSARYGLRGLEIIPE
jgi:hypothetical protein